MPIVRLAYITNEQAKESYVYVPICKYNEERGIEIKEYKDVFCKPKAFQLTFNEYGMCFTFNNHKQGMDEHFYAANSEGVILKQNYTKLEVTGSETNNTAHADFEDPSQDILKVLNHYKT